TANFFAPSKNERRSISPCTYLSKRFSSSCGKSEAFFRSMRSYTITSARRRMAHFSLKVNSKAHPVDVDPDSPLLYVLRDDAGLNNARFGCGLGQCGACTVLVGGVATRSCVLPVSRAAGKEILTLEGLGTPENPDPVQKAFIEEQAFQCGYCLNGWVLSAKAL